MQSTEGRSLRELDGFLGLFFLMVSIVINERKGSFFIRI